MTIQWQKIVPALPLALLISSAYAQDATDRGEKLAQAGDCVACHSTVDGKPFAGGLKMSTPVGAIYSTNITPDKATGIGDYSYEEFAKALRKGVAKDGHNLYPAMPYTSFSRINDEDMHALYNFFMHKVTPVKQENRDSDIPWPLNMRWPLFAWNLMFHDDKRFTPDSSKSEEWNRGAYLVQGLAHCSTCHTPRGIGFQEKAQDQSESEWLSGGTLEGWHAPDLTGTMQGGLGRWSQQDIVAFLKTGQTEHSTAFGSMRDVVENSTQHLSDSDLNAIAVYLKSLKPSGPDAPEPKPDNATTEALIKGDMSKPGAQEYVDNCSACHRLDGKGYAHTFPRLAHNSAVLSDDPSSLISIVLQGGQAPITRNAVTGLSMPDFAWRLSDKQLADLLTFVRSGWGNNAGPVTPDQVKDLRSALPPETAKKEAP